MRLERIKEMREIARGLLRSGYDDVKDGGLALEEACDHLEALHEGLKQVALGNARIQWSKE